MTIQSINQWPTSERPREKLLQHGAKSLSDAELIALLLQTGVQGQTALDIARSLLTEYGSLKKLFQATTTHLLKQSGVGPAKLAQLYAGIELGKRYFASEVQPKMQLKSSHLTKQFLQYRLQDYTHEVFACLFLDSRHKLICFEELFHGTLNEASIYPREVAKRGLQHNAASIILAHNHPSGDCTPSHTDKLVTQQLAKALALIDIKILDHMVIGDRCVFSFAEHGLV